MGLLVLLHFNMVLHIKFEFFVYALIDDGF